MSDHVLIAHFVGFQNPCLKHLNSKLKQGNAIYITEWHQQHTHVIQIHNNNLWDNQYFA